MHNKQCPAHRQHTPPQAGTSPSKQHCCNAAAPCNCHSNHASAAEVQLPGRFNCPACLVTYGMLAMLVHTSVNRVIRGTTPPPATQAWVLGRTWELARCANVCTGIIWCARRVIMPDVAHVILGMAPNGLLHTDSTATSDVSLSEHQAAALTMPVHTVGPKLPQHTQLPFYGHVNRHSVQKQQHKVPYKPQKLLFHHTHLQRNLALEAFSAA